MPKIICGTGHRWKTLGNPRQNSVQLEKLAILAIEKTEPDLVISGMALGWDQALVNACRHLRVPFHAYVPCLHQESPWPEQVQRDYRFMLEDAERVVYCSTEPYTNWCMNHRNCAMVNDSDAVLALWNGIQRGGTWNCIDYAISKEKPVVNAWNRWVDDFRIEGV